MTTDVDSLSQFMEEDIIACQKKRLESYLGKPIDAAIETAELKAIDDAERVDAEFVKAYEAGLLKEHRDCLTKYVRILRDPTECSKHPTMEELVRFKQYMFLQLVKVEEKCKRLQEEVDGLKSSLAEKGNNGL